MSVIGGMIVRGRFRGYNFNDDFYVLKFVDDVGLSEFTDDNGA